MIPSARHRRVRLALFDCGAGNLNSLHKALERAGAEVRVEHDPGALLEADGMVLPGAGAFGAAAARLAPALPQLVSSVSADYPCLGVCLGMQLLFDSSEQSPGRGLGVIPGRVRLLQARRVPHMGWNTVESVRPDPLLSEDEPLVAYFASSYAAVPDDPWDVIATTTYAGQRLSAVVRRGRAWGVQFRPEKSGTEGLRVIGRFVAQVAAASGPGSSE